MPDAPRPSPAAPTGDAPPEGLTPAEMVDPRVVRLVDRREQRMKEAAAAEAQRALAEHRASKAFAPRKREPLWAAIFVGTVMACGPILMLESPKWNILLGAAAMGAASAVGTYFGIRSSGTTK